MFVLSLLFFAPLAVVDPPVKADFVVATNGSDDNPGTAAKPFATLARARVGGEHDALPMGRDAGLEVE